MMEYRNGDNDHKDFRMNSGALANITRTVTNLTNGVQITETTSDSGTLARLQEIYTKGQNQKDLPNSNTSVVRTMLSNGLQTVITSTDAATVTDIQAKAAKSPAGFGVGLGYFKNGQGENEQKNMHETNKMNRGNDAKSVTKASLPANISPLIDAKLATLSTADAKLAWLNAVNAKIDALSAKVTAQKSKDVLGALKDLLNQKIDAINNVGVDSSIINNLLQ